MPPLHPSTSIIDFSGRGERWLTCKTGFLAVSRRALSACLIGLMATCIVGCKQKTVDGLSGDDTSHTPSTGEAELRIAESADPNEKRPTQSTALTAPTVTNGKLKPNEIIDRTKPIVDEHGVTFVPAQFNKNNSLLVLAFEADIRADFVVMTARTILNPEQIVRAKQMALSYENQFQNLARQRAAILEAANDEDDVDRQVLKVQMKLATLLKQIRMRINSDIMTQAQRDESQRLYLEKMAEKASKKKADATNKAGAIAAEK